MLVLRSRTVGEQGRHKQSYKQTHSSLNGGLALQRVYIYGDMSKSVDQRCAHYCITNSSTGTLSSWHGQSLNSPHGQTRHCSQNDDFRNKASALLQPAPLPCTVNMLHANCPADRKSSQPHAAQSTVPDNLRHPPPCALQLHLGGDQVCPHFRWA